MRLTTQMLAEIESIDKRMSDLRFERDLRRQSQGVADLAVLLQGRR